jgi:tetratricopeptide (TPR) repeat protein
MIVCFQVITTEAQQVESVADVYGAIENGDIEQARHRLSFLIKNDGSSPELLYLSGKLTADADSAVSYFEHALQRSNDDDLIAQSLIGIANYYLVAGNVEQALDIIDDHRKRCDDSPHYGELMQLRALLRFQIDKEDKSRGEVEKALKNSEDPETTAKLLLVLGDIEYARKKYEDAAKYYRKLANRTDERYAGAAILRLIDAYRQQGDHDNAQFAYSIAAERYPLTLGLKDLQSRYSSDAADDAVEQSDTVDPSSLEKPTYAVRVGTYSQRENAEKQKEFFARQGYTAKITLVRISSRTYYVVDIGRFDNRADAAQFMEKLQKQNRDRYHLVTV